MRLAIAHASGGDSSTTRAVLLALLLLPAFALPASAADEPLKLADQLLLRGKYAEAEEAYRGALADHPEQATLGVVRALRATGQYDEAEKLVSKALKEKPTANLATQSADLALVRGDLAAAAEAIAQALKLNANHVGARSAQSELQLARGELAETEATCKWLVDYYNGQDLNDPDDIYAVALGAAQYARWKRLTDEFSNIVNQVLPAALEKEPLYWPAHFEAGMLFLEKYNEPEAQREFKAALAINPNAAEVYAGMAALAVQNLELADAERAVARALEINPNLLEAHLAKADVLLANFKSREAIELLENNHKAHKVDELLEGRLAGAYLLVDGLSATGADTRFGKLAAEVAKRNPHCGRFYQALAASLDLCRRYPAAAEYFQQAQKHMPQLVGPAGDLGMVYMRLGQEADARPLLDRAFEMDPFNVRVSNTLKVLEVLDDYAVLETDHFVIKFDRGKDELLARYASRYLERDVYPKLVKHYGFAPKGKSLIEIFSRARNTSAHGWFSARMVGLPSIGTVGACAGKMVAITSPNDMPEKFNWGRVLRHEFVHVLNLQQTEFNVPHWFTEALAVMAEEIPRPQSWNELLAERVPKGELFTLEDINLGFARPGSNRDWQMAYCQAELYARYAQQRFGDDALARLLRGYADNLDTKAALDREFHVTVEDFEKGYLEYLKTLVAGLKTTAHEPQQEPAELERALAKTPNDPDLIARQALQKYSAKEYPEARKLAQRAIGLKAGHPLATYVLARVHMVVGEDDQAKKLLEQALDRKKPDGRLLGLLAAIFVKQGAQDEAIGLYELAQKTWPDDLQWSKALARVYLQRTGDVRLYEPLSRIAEHDYDDVASRKKLLEMALAKRDFTAAARWGEEAVQIDVVDPNIHEPLARAYEALKRFDDAAFEYEALVRLEGKKSTHYLKLAETYAHAGQKDEARKAVTTLLEHDPDNTAGKKLLEGLK